MPLINGIKMACEPCIRGHRSTKCTHANERLMVPVKKPGRPLSACPHLHDQLCGCSSVTAAIPRRSTCGCGSGAHGHGHAPTMAEVRPLPSAIPDVPSPTKVTFKVQKNSSRPSSRKYNFHPDNFSKIEAANVNIAPVQPGKKPQMIAPAVPNGHSVSVPNNAYENAMSQPPASKTTMDNSHISYSLQKNEKPNANNLVGSNGTYTPPNTMMNGSLPLSDNPVFSRATNTILANVINGDTPPLSRQSSASGGCCSCKSRPPLSNQPSISSDGSISNNKMEHYPFPSTYSSHQPSYPNFMPQPTVNAYPSTFGSHDNPLQPTEWRQNIMANMYNQSPISLDGLAPTSDLSNFSAPASNQFDFPSDIFHACGCGDDCQCIGCLAHPYNQATIENVRSAVKVQQLSISTPTTSDFDPPLNGPLEFSPGGTPITTASNGHPLDGFTNANLNGINSTISGMESSSSKTGGSETPSDATGEDQIYAADDFFFVNYSLGGDACGGETASCPCGDGCECLGCTIHRGLPPVPLSESTIAQTGQIDAGINGMGMEFKKEKLDEIDEQKYFDLLGIDMRQLATPAPLPMPVKKSCCSS